jgi:hypothetical protein
MLLPSRLPVISKYFAPGKYCSRFGKIVQLMERHTLSTNPLQMQQTRKQIAKQVMEDYKEMKKESGGQPMKGYGSCKKPAFTTPT